MPDTDIQQRFLFEHSDVRGDFIRLGASYQAACGRYDYPAAVAQQLGQALVASTLLSATIKYSGSLVLQIQSSGPINMLVAQCNHKRHIRGLARWQAEVPQGGLAQLYGQGRMVITIDNERNDERYQGIVGLDGTSLATAIESYFKQSEQLETRLWLAADAERAAGLLLQRLPGNQSSDSDLWRRVEMLTATVTEREMLALPTDELLHRLFHEEDIRLFEPEPVSFRCSCSREKIATMLKGLGREEAETILQEQGAIEVGCDFCNHHYQFDKIDVEEIFASPLQPPVSETRH